MDTGCNKSIAGTRWIKEFVRVLSREDGRRVERDGVDGYQGFGVGACAICRVMLAWYVVEVSVPLLWGGESMKRDKVLLDLRNDGIGVRRMRRDLVVGMVVVMV